MDYRKTKAKLLKEGSNGRNMQISYGYAANRHHIMGLSFPLTRPL